MVIIVFDVGGVLVRFDQSITIKRLIELGVHKNKARLFFHTDEYFHFARGDITAKTFFRSIKKECSKKITYAQAKKAHNDHIYTAYRETIEILKRLKRRKKEIAILTDANSWQEDRVKELVGLEQYTRKIFQSQKIGLLKIDDGTFKLAAQRLKTDPKDIIFIDDSPEKIERAKEIGIDTILFKDHKQLERELKKRNIL